MYGQHSINQQFFACCLCVTACIQLSHLWCRWLMLSFQQDHSQCTHHTLCSHFVCWDNFEGTVCEPDQSATNVIFTSLATHVDFEAFFSKTLSKSRFQTWLVPHTLEVSLFENIWSCEYNLCVHWVIVAVSHPTRWKLNEKALQNPCKVYLLWQK